MSTNPGSEGVNSVPLANLAATTSSTLNQITPSDNGLQGLTSSLTPGSAAGSSSGPADTLKPPRSISDVKKSSRSLRLRVNVIANDNANVTMQVGDNVIFKCIDGLVKATTTSVDDILTMLLSVYLEGTLTQADFQAATSTDIHTCFVYINVPGTTVANCINEIVTNYNTSLENNLVNIEISTQLSTGNSDANHNSCSYLMSPAMEVVGELAYMIMITFNIIAVFDFLLGIFIREFKLWWSLLPLSIAIALYALARLIRTVCLWHEQVAVPVYTSYILPVQEVAAQKWVEVDSKLKISETVGPKLDQAYQVVSNTYKQYLEPTVAHVSRQAIIFYYGSVLPRLQKLYLWLNVKSNDLKLDAITWYYNVGKPLATRWAINLETYYALAAVKFNVYYQIASVKAKGYYKVASFKARIYFSTLYTRASIYCKMAERYLLVKWNTFVDKYVADDVRELFGVLFGYLEKGYAELLRAFTILRQKTHDFTKDRKNDFVKSEFNNLERFNNFKKSLNSTLIDFTQKFLKLERNNLQNGTIKKEAVDDSESEYGDSDEEPIHSTIVSTIIVTKSNGVVPSGQPGTGVGQTNEIDAEVTFWSEKIFKTLQLASDNLVADMTPKADSHIDMIKGEVLKLLQKIQVSNHNQYKLLNVFIGDIHKDYEAIIDSGNKTIVESVSREKVREEFQKTYNETEINSGKIQNILIEAHGKILEAYYETVQNTIDIIQLFAENTLQDYLNFLNNLPADLDETYSWGLWKDFYKSKENIYNFRDDLFNQFNAYKEQPKKADTPLGLEKWAEYLRNIEFTLNYLLRDNTEYLRLARARANLAFQLREELVSKIEQEAEKFVEEVEEVDADDEASSVESETEAFPDEISSSASINEEGPQIVEELTEAEFVSETAESETESGAVTESELATEDSATEYIESEPATEKSATEEIEFATEEVESATEEVESVTEEVESATEEVESATEEIESTTEEVESATEEIETATEESATEDFNSEADAIEIAEPSLESPDAKEPDTQEPELEEVPEL
ncbi:uncharacterized protein KQ657_003150 [Scheffersomyces spartinae]|uniref:Uncharacterized protein n=1 Tax=Scheffersomyces spartinae TaxID=45513 RepID=A0A9P8AK07_9ASCO|nr:uncharacterized protein KQ657_003150 [Scheffersomyces spartinae]KAG7195392.1 hypothetical protein KQ657_003150 [Scheffersomyces spartinae]